MKCNDQKFTERSIKVVSWKSTSNSCGFCFCKN